MAGIDEVLVTYGSALRRKHGAAGCSRGDKPFDLAEIAVVYFAGHGSQARNDTEDRGLATVAGAYDDERQCGRMPVRGIAGGS